MFFKRYVYVVYCLFLIFFQITKLPVFLSLKFIDINVVYSYWCVNLHKTALGVV